MSKEGLPVGVSLVMLAYREEENLRVLLPEINKELDKCCPDHEILVVDTAKPLDNSQQVCEENGARYVNQALPGFGGAMKKGIESVTYDKFIIMDSDGSHPPRFIPDIYSAYMTGKYDVVIGSRYTKGGVTHDAKSSQIMSRLLNFAFRVVTGIHAAELSTNYRMYDTMSVRQLELKCEKYDILEETLMKLKLAKPGHKLSVGEVPIEFNKRLNGESKRDLLPFIISYIKTLFQMLGLRISHIGK